MNKIIIPLNPVPASRPRVTRYGVYYGKKHTQFIKEVQGLYDFKVIKNPDVKQKGLFRVNAIYYCAIPKSTSKKKTALLNNTYCDKKIDLDNIDKLVRDEIVSRYIEDDCFIVESESKKYWSTEPRIELLITNIDKKN